MLKSWWSRFGRVHSWLLVSLVGIIADSGLTAKVA
jgi:hypothetical protein